MLTEDRTPAALKVSSYVAFYSKSNATGCIPLFKPGRKMALLKEQERKQEVDSWRPLEANGRITRNV